MTPEADIADALLSAVSTIAGTLALPVAMPGIVFPPADHPEYSEQVHLEVRHFRNTNISAWWGTEVIYIGILQISVIDPTQVGEIAPTEYAGQIAEAFKKNRVIQTTEGKRIQVYENPTVLSSIEYGQKTAYPVSIPYRCSKA